MSLLLAVALVLIVVVFLALCGVVGHVVRREWRVFHAAERDRPATLEGGGSHLSQSRRPDGF